MNDGDTQMGKNEFLNKIKENRQKAKDANDPKKYQPKFKKGEIIYNSKYDIVTKVANIRFFVPSLAYESKNPLANYREHIPHYIMWDIHNKNYGEQLRDPSMKPKKRVRICQSIDVYYQPASQAQKILFEQAWVSSGEEE